MKRTYFKATFTALVEEPTEELARESAEIALEAIRDYVGEGASADPLIYKPELVSVEPYTGPDPFAEDDEELAELADRARRAEAALTALVSAITAPDARTRGSPLRCETPAKCSLPRRLVTVRSRPKMPR